MQKYYTIMTLINGIPQHIEKTKGVLYYSEGEAEFHISKWFQDNDQNVYIILPVYKNRLSSSIESKSNYHETREMITKKYPAL